MRAQASSDTSDFVTHWYSNFMINFAMPHLDRFLCQSRRIPGSGDLFGCFSTALEAFQGPKTTNRHCPSNQTIKYIHYSQSFASDKDHIGPKGVLRSLLSEGPRTAEELWEHAEKEGLKSKRFMKTLLQQMRQNGEISTSPRKHDSESQTHNGHGSLNFVYRKPT